MLRFIALGVTLLVAAHATAVEPPKEEDRLQELWQAVEFQFQGEPAPAEVVKQFQIRIKGNEFAFNPKSENRKHTLKLVADSKPKGFDLTPQDGPGKGKTTPCAIYELSGDKLTICIDKEAKSGKRPAEFKTTAGDGLALIVFERVKEKK